MLVTGATGMVGGEIALELHRAGYDVTALARPASDRSHLLSGEITFAEGDVTDQNAVRQAMEGQDLVCHAAALVPGSGADEDGFNRVNVSGTRIVCEAAIKAGVSRLLHVSTVHVFGIHPGQRVDETATPSEPPHPGYDASKARAESAVLEFAAKSLDAVVVNPTVVFGPRSRHSGRLINMFLRGRLPIIPLPNRVLSLVYSRDVARGARMALETGEQGERYILAGPSVSVREFIDTLAQVSGRRAPRISLPGWAAAAGVAALWGVSPVTRWKPPVTVAGVRRGGTVYEGERATRELGLRYTPLEDALRTTAEWLQRPE